MTPSLARMVMSRAGVLPMPIKWFSIPQCWRYERMQKGRGREHFQWNVDIWGTSEISADAELFSVITTFLEGVGLTEEDAIKEASRCMSCGMCFECDNCVIYCPQDAVFRVKKDVATMG